MTKHNLIYTWLLISFELRKENGEVIYPFGQDVAVRLIYASSGLFAYPPENGGKPLSFQMGKGKISPVNTN